MTHSYHNFRLLFSMLLLAFSSALFAQQTVVVQMNGVKMRAPLSVSKGVSTLQLCGLEAGNTYRLAAVPMSYAQKAGFDISPDASWPSHSFRQDKRHHLQFTASSECVTLQLLAESPEQGTEIPMYLSVKCESCPDAHDWLNRVSGLGEQAVIEVQDGFSAQELVENVLVGGGCFQISDVTYSGHPSQIGVFSNGSNNIGFSEGVIMATGNIIVAPGPNDADGLSSGFGFTTPDAELETLTPGSIFDMANIEFDFVPTQNQVAFEFVFASEEYCEYVQSQFNDVFGFFISGPGIIGTKNIALIPNTNIPITINNVNHVFNNTLYTHNTPITGDNCLDGGSSGNLPPAIPAFGPAVFEVQYDGFTKKLVATANVIPCQTYHIKLKIGDVGDGVWDSAVFLRANSFSAGGEVLASPAYPGGFGTAYESCDAGNIRFVRGSNADVSQPLVIHFNVAGSATPGVDYVPLSSPVTIPAGETELLVPVQVIPDALIEGQENILVQVPNSCSCSESTIEFLINDRPAMTIESNDQLLCAGETATISPFVSGGLPGYTYLWSTGETTASISTSTTGTYTLSVFDACGGNVSVSTEIVFEACGCASETFLKTLEFDDAQVRGYGVYDSQDGNLYITGAKQDSAVLIKMTPSGAILWMRTFDVQDGANDHISEIILDSEGMIVGCGQSGDLQPGISGFFFRYDPVANNLLWINTYGLESPYVMGLMEL
ncbi:MAG: choice-of-anchor L domain-containing protein, partial [Saprospiraceae bacterium]|nr:choice-of-anchor L domain-containing protein [Saprospiraceae bacterium]